MGISVFQASAFFSSFGHDSHIPCHAHRGTLFLAQREAELQKTQSYPLRLSSLSSSPTQPSKPPVSQSHQRVCFTFLALYSYIIITSFKRAMSIDHVNYATQHITKL